MIRRAFAAAMVAAAVGVAGPAPAEDGLPPWVEIDYSEVVDTRQLSHSGESVGELIESLDGRGVPRAGERPADRLMHSLLQPLVEPYAFVIADALDSLIPLEGDPRVEVGSLWDPGEAQPAWVELLRARRYVVESDGTGRIRAALPWRGSAPALPAVESRTAAEAAWKDAWPVLRHVLAAERRRLASKSKAEPPPLRVTVYPYRHLPERSEFHLGLTPHEAVVEDTRPDGLRPPLGLGRIQEFLNSGLRLEGARLEPDGTVRLLGSPSPDGSLLLGRRLALSDFAVAHRAVVHGGLAEPYMSLDRGLSPETSIVNYGGRLRDTSLGLISLLCDIRFKTFSLGLDIVQGDDLRERLRRRIPEFRTHLEHLFAHPDSEGMSSQNTRLWFYPDSVDLTLSPQGDVLVMRRVRMSASSERLQDQTKEVPPWTRTTVDAINQEYDTLAEFFPEMADLDQAVRLLSLFTWLRQAQGGELLAPELDALLAVELPALHTPREFPQLLAFNAFPPAGSELGVDVVNRVPVAEALERLSPAYGRALPAAERFERAAAALDPRQEDHARLLSQFEAVKREGAPEIVLDRMAYRAERLRMHQRVLATQDPGELTVLDAWKRLGRRPRVFSVGIGGLDLGMNQVLARASGTRLDLAGGLGFGGGAGGGPTGSAVAGGGAPAAVREPRESWRRDPDLLPKTMLPDHGRDAAGGGAAKHRVETVAGGGATAIRQVYGADHREARVRTVVLDARRRAAEFERLEQLRLVRYAMERSGARITVRTRASSSLLPVSASPTSTSLPPGLGLLEVVTGESERQADKIPLRLRSASSGGRSLEAGFPRRILERLVLGREVDLTPSQPLSGLAPLPPGLGDVKTMMVVLNPEQLSAPWTGGAVPVAAEQDPVRIGRALNEWWSEASAVVGAAMPGSASRWSSAPRPGADALLVLPAEGFDARSGALREALREAWSPGPVVESLPAAVGADLVLVVSAEPPALFASRLRELARDPRIEGKLLAVWPLAGPIRQDLPASLLEEGRLGGLGVAAPRLVGRREVPSSLAALGRALRESGGSSRVESLSRVFLWHF